MYSMKNSQYTMISIRLCSGTRGRLRWVGLLRLHAGQPIVGGVVGGLSRHQGWQASAMGCGCEGGRVWLSFLSASSWCVARRPLSRAFLTWALLGYAALLLADPPPELR